MVLGRFLIKEEEEITDLVIYKLNHTTGQFELEKQSEFMFSDACIQFEFSIDNNGQLLFFTKSELFSFDYYMGIKKTVHKFENELDDQPNFGTFSFDQRKFIVTSSADILHVDLDSGIETDLDDQEEIGQIENILCDDDHFYIMANKKEGRLGYYLLYHPIDQPMNTDYLIRWGNKLDIGDCDLQLMEEKDYKTGKMERSIVVSFKSIGINTYNVLVISL